jgi:tetratricopeptide (TPR) repeat protein
LERLWPVLYGDNRGEKLSINEASTRFEEAYKSWPGFEIAEHHGEFLLTQAEREGLGEPMVVELREKAIKTYREAVSQNPNNPEIAVNLGNVLSVAGHFDEAERELERAVAIPGFLEPVFRARFYLAQAIHREWYFRWTGERRSGEALSEFLRARDLVALSKSLHHPYYWERDCSKFQVDLNQTIEFLEGAGVQPAKNDE